MSSSSVYYKFKSQREPSRITFDGTSISVWDLKREIILQNKMGKGVDFDLGLYNADTEEEYKDDNHGISRSSTVIVRRLPPSRPGRGTAQMYVADLQADGGESSRFGGPQGGPGGRDDRNRGPSYRGPMSMRFDDRNPQRESSSSATPAPPPSIPSTITDQNKDEAASIAAMFQATTDQWDATQEKMAQATFRSRGGAPHRGGPPRNFTPRDNPHPDRPPPIGYICYRCGQKGHWIQECPTNQDPDWDNKPRFKRTTGIPRSMLKTVEAPTDEQRQAGVMITADGTYVVAQVDNATWEKTRTQIKPLSRSDVFQSVPSDSSMACPLCSKLLKAAVQTPCCATRYCEECIQNHLLEHDFTCAECEKRIADLGNLKRDDEMRKKVEKYVEEAVERSEAEIKEREEREEAEAKAKAEKDEAEKAAAANGEGEGNPDSSSGDAAKDATAGGPAAGGAMGANVRPPMPAPNNGPAAMPSNEPAVIFNPQLVQQLVMTLANPQLPPPMRMVLQTQLQAQQMAFMRMQQHGGAAMAVSAPRPPAGMGGMGMGGMGGMGMGPMGMGGMNQHQHQQQFRPPMGGGMGNMGMGMGNFGNGNPNGGWGPGAANQQGMMNRNMGRPQAGQKRERGTDFVELGGGARGGPGNKTARMG